MPVSEDISLLKRYADGDEPAFTLLVERYIHLVYSTALRQLGNSSHAEEISQAVFIILTRKAKSISPKTILSGWLYQTARLTAANFLRSENSRQQREQEAYMQSTLTESGSASWDEMAPLLEEAMGRLGQADRDAIVLRFFENRPPQELAAMLGLSEVTARKRVSRALERLRNYFSKRGVDSTTSAIAETISRNAVQVAPVGLAKSVTAMALAKGAAASASTLTLIKGALKLMAWTKMKTAIAVGIGILFVAGATTTVTVEKIHEHLNDEWQLGNISSEFLYKPPYRTVILPTKSAKRSPKNGTGGRSQTADGRGYGINDSIEDIARFAYYQADGKGYSEFSPARTILDNELPTNQYDYFSNLPRGARDAMQNEIRKKFDLTGEVKTIETNVLVLDVEYSSPTGLKPSRTRLGDGHAGNGTLSMKGETMDELAMMLEYTLKIPVINQTKLTGNFDFQIQWNEDGPDYPNPEGLKQALKRQLGLELVPTNMPIEMLVVGKAN